MVNKKIFLMMFAVSIVAFLFSKNVYAADNMTFSEAMDRLYGHNESVEASKMMVESMKQEKNAAVGLFFPKVSLNAVYGAFDKDLSMDVDLKGPIRNAAGQFINIPVVGPMINDAINKLPTLNQTIQQKSFLSIDATAIWPIFTGGKIIAANQAAKLKLEKAKYDGDDVKGELGSTLAERYFSLRLAEDVTDLRKNVYEAMQNHYKQAQKMEQAGILAKVERMHAAVALQDAKREYDSSMRDEQLAMVALKSILNKDEDIKPATHLFVIAPESIDNISYFKHAAIYGNHKLQGAAVIQKLSHVSVNNEMATFYPKVFLFGNAQIYNWQVSSLMPDFTFGVGVNFTIFEGLSGIYKVKAAKALEKSVYLKRIRASKDIQTLVEQEYITMSNARSDYESAQASIDFTKEYYNARSKAFKMGLATSLDVVDAELAYSKAKLDSIVAAYKFDTALAKLLDTSGMFGDFESYMQKASVELGMDNK